MQGERFSSDLTVVNSREKEYTQQKNKQKLGTANHYVFAYMTPVKTAGKRNLDEACEDGGEKRTSMKPVKTEDHAAPFF